MHSFRAGLPDGIHDPVNDEIGLGRGRRTDIHCLIGHAYMKGLRIGVRADGNRGNAHFFRRADDPARDFAAIGYQNFSKHAPAYHIFCCPFMGYW